MNTSELQAWHAVVTGRSSLHGTQRKIDRIHDEVTR